ncbi:MAG: DbpA RNA binding domain-containing protein [Spirochaetes bacterium]|nr:DbpA RNA binding domain-containing protein [Spirochaetota bacterium]
MSIESQENKIPEEAMNAFLDGILSELKTPADPAMLTEVRAIFRKRIPLHLRSYAASLLIMRAAGMTRTTTLHPASQGPAPNPARFPSPAKSQNPPKSQSPVKPQSAEAAPEHKRTPTPKLAEPTVPLFVSMGKRQRLRPQELRDLITEKTGILNEELGRVHLFDNYSFIDVQISHAEKVVAACDGAPFKGRNIEIKPAKKKSGEAQEKDLAE